MKKIEGHKCSPSDPSNPSQHFFISDFGQSWGQGLSVIPYVCIIFGLGQLYSTVNLLMDIHLFETLKIFNCSDSGTGRTGRTDGYQKYQ